MANPYFSVIIPCLNEEKYLPKLLKNLENQTFKDFEVVIVDGKSEDKTVKEAKKFANPLKIHILTADKRNVSFQRNLGAKNTHAARLIFFDADTKVPRTFFKKIADIFEKDNADIVNSWIKTPSKLETDKAIATGTNAIFELTKFIARPSCYGAFIAVRKDVFTQVKGFDEELKFAEDSEFLQRVVAAGYKYVIARNTYYYYSLRRFKKEGTLNLIRKTAILNLNRSLKLDRFLNVPDYKMGGHIFEKIDDKGSLIWLEQAVNEVRLNYQKNLTENKKFLKKLFEEFK